MKRVQTYDSTFRSSPPPAHKRVSNQTKTIAAPSLNHCAPNATIFNRVRPFIEKLEKSPILSATSTRVTHLWPREATLSQRSPSNSAAQHPDRQLNPACRAVAAREHLDPGFAFLLPFRTTETASSSSLPVLWPRDGTLTLPLTHTADLKFGKPLFVFLRTPQSRERVWRLESS